MQHLLIPGAADRPLVFYLAMEEHVAKTYGEGFFMWSSAPTVIFGRNQDMEAEVNLEWCRESGVAVFRRKSGGGCVYSDRGNLMLSYISRETNVQAAFEAYLDMLCAALRELGADAVSTSRNDVLVAGRKVSGNACFGTGTGSIVHGTLLYDVDLQAMASAITPSRQKLDRHGIESVRQRVANLKPLLGRPLSELKEVLAGHFTDSELSLGEKDMEAADLISRDYLEESFIKGRF